MSKNDIKGLRRNKSVQKPDSLHPLQVDLFQRSIIIQKQRLDIVNGKFFMRSSNFGSPQRDYARKKKIVDAVFEQFLNIKRGNLKKIEKNFNIPHSTLCG